VLRQDFLEELVRKRVEGMDVIQRVENLFGFGMMLGLGPEKNCFGHPGAGGSYGMANAETGESFAFVMNHFEPNLYPSKERLLLVKGAI
jgi:CubicO group peptidase (beta-lactamase class C family)